MWYLGLIQILALSLFQQPAENSTGWIRLEQGFITEIHHEKCQGVIMKAKQEIFYTQSGIPKLQCLSVPISLHLHFLPCVQQRI